MNWADSPDQANFRTEVRSFIAEQRPGRYTEPALVEHSANDAWLIDRRSSDRAIREAAHLWSTALAQRGWVAPHWPEEYGGAGLGPLEQLIFSEEMAAAEAPRVGGLGVSLFGPTVIVHGDARQRAELLPPIAAGTIVWAQGYSEPSAGSDLAALQTTAEREGDAYRINGQKIWTTGGHLADALFMLVRSNPDAPKHRGISFVYADARTPGIDIRPILNPLGSHSFNEIFLDEVRIPAGQRIGDEDRGWYVAMTLLDVERSGIDIVTDARRTLEKLLDAVRTQPAVRARISDSASRRHDIAAAHVAGEVARNFSLRIASIQATGGVPNHEASMTKMFATELHQASVRSAVNAHGLAGQLVADPHSGSFARAYVETLSLTIAGGTSEIQRNVIATRGLGLPRA